MALGLFAVTGPTFTSRAESPRTRRFELVLKAGKLAGTDTVIRVHKGDMVELSWTTDAVATIHLHGYDIEQRLGPDGPTVMSFKAHATGRFPVNLHGGHGDSHHGAMLYLEVLPR